MLTTDFTATETDFFLTNIKYLFSFTAQKIFALLKQILIYIEFSSIKESQSHGALIKLSKRTL